MNIDAIITQIKTYAPMFSVAGAADFETGIATTTNMPFPSAFVIPLGEMPELANEDATGLYQTVDERIGVIVEVTATADRRGQSAVTSLDTLRTALFSAILNWRYDENAQKGLSYVGAELLVFDRARLFWKWEFSNIYTLTDADGFQITGTPLTDIQTTDLNTPTTFDTPISQV